MIGIVNYRMGNLASVQHALNHLNIANTIVHVSAEIEKCDQLILPGVGAFGKAMEALQELQLIDGLSEHILHKKKPVLGLCLGMQLLFDQSEEMGDHEGLKMTKGNVRSLKNEISRLPVPHMGWNQVKESGTSALLKNIPEEERVFYFVHSFYCDASDRNVVSGTTEYGLSFDAMIENENIFGCQFHPEKSQQSGLAVLKNFAAIQ